MVCVVYHSLECKLSVNNEKCFHDKREEINFDTSQVFCRFV